MTISEPIRLDASSACDAITYAASEIVKFPFRAAGRFICATGSFVCGLASSCRKKISFDRNLAAMLVNCRKVKGKLEIVANVRSFVSDNWENLDLPASCNNSANQKFLAGKISKVLLDHDQSPEIKTKIISNIIANFKTHIIEAVNRVENDLSKDDVFLAKLEIKPNSQIVNIQVLDSKTRHQGRVPLLIFLKEDRSSAIRTFVYKPRSMIGEKIICGDKASLFASAGLGFYQVHDKGTYGYSEFIENREEENTFYSRDELRSYFDQFHLMDTLLAPLGFGDCHGGNVVTSRKRPYLIDLEIRTPIIAERGFPETSLLTGMIAGRYPSSKSKNRVWFFPSVIQNIRPLNDEYDGPDSAEFLRKLDVLRELNEPVPLTEDVLAKIQDLSTYLLDHPHRICLDQPASLLRRITEDIDKGFANFHESLKFGLKDWDFVSSYDSQDLKERYTRDVMNNDLPIFYYHPKTGRVYYNNLLLGTRQI